MQPPWLGTGGLHINTSSFHKTAENGENNLGF